MATTHSAVRSILLAFRPRYSRHQPPTTSLPRRPHLIASKASSPIRTLTTTTPSHARIDRTATNTAEAEISAAENEALLLEADPDNFKAAPEISFEEQNEEALYDRGEKLLRSLRIVPASPSYFTAKPNFTDDYLHLQRVVRRSITLPTIKAIDAPRVAWRALDTYRAMTDENVRSSKYKRMLEMLKRMNLIHPSLIPSEVQAAMDVWKRDIQPFNNRPAPILIDDFGVASAVGRRKASSAKAWIVEGEGEVLVNGKPLHMAFARVHDRESVIWALKSTGRMDKYNVWATVHGGGTTGQAEALTLAVSKGLMAHEPALKVALRRGMLHVTYHLEQVLLTVHASWMCRKRSEKS
jgi:small subunit ribosomal protein S9